MKVFKLKKAEFGYYNKVRKIGREKRHARKYSKRKGQGETKEKGGQRIATEKGRLCERRGKGA